MFWTEAQRHVVLAVGSLVVAVLAGLPLGVLCHRVDAVRAPVLEARELERGIKPDAFTMQKPPSRRPLS